MSIYRLRTEMGHYFKWLLLLVVVPIFVIGGAFYFGGSGGNQGSTSSREKEVLATVNGANIMRDEFEILWDQMYDRARRSGMRATIQLADMRMMLFQQLVSSRLLVSAAQQLGVDVSDRAVNEELDKLVTMSLRDNRRMVLGKLSPKREATDPREDKEYISELERSGLSLAQQEEMARGRYPIEQVRAQVAQEGVRRVLASRAKPVTDRDIIASYNVYKIRQIVLQDTLPEAQLAARATKIRREAIAGADFAKLAAENTADLAARRTGGAAVYSFDTRQMYPPAVQKAIERLKPGEISPVVKVPGAIIIVKLESMKAELPEKLDAKTKNARRDAIKQDRERTVAAAFNEEVRARQRVKVVDPECRAYWLLISAKNEQEYKKQLKMAIVSLRKASESRHNTYAQIQLVRLLDRDGKTAEAVRILYPMLEGETQSIESPDLRILLGDMLLKTNIKGDKDRAIQQFVRAGEAAPHDLDIHTQIMNRFKQNNKPDLAAKEDEWIAAYNKRMTEYAEMRKKQGSEPVRNTLPTPATAGQ